MGQVYRARDTELGRDVAIKILLRVFTSDPERRARFELEARVLAALNKPNIATIYGIEQRDGVRGIVMELVEGETLAERRAIESTTLLRGGSDLNRPLPLRCQPSRSQVAPIPGGS
jgi:serine/threonine protein kinase